MVYMITITIVVTIEIGLIAEIQLLKSELHFLHQAIQYRHDYLLKEIRKEKENAGNDLQG